MGGNLLPCYVLARATPGFTKRRRTLEPKTLFRSLMRCRGMQLRGIKDLKKNISDRAVTCVAANSMTKFMRKQNFFWAAMSVLVWAITFPSANAQTFKVLHEFNGQTDGALPQGALLQDAAGNLFGTTFAGSSIGEGTVYKLDSRGAESVLFSFNAFVSGSNPASALIQDQSGNLVGTADGGPGGAGIIYKISRRARRDCCFPSRRNGS